MAVDMLQILIAENEPDDALVIKQRLMACNGFQCEVELVHTFLECLDSVNERPPSLVILGLDLPDAKGIKRSLIKLHSKVPQVPILISMDEDESELVHRVLVEGAQDVISKRHLDASSFERTILHAIARQEGFADFSRYTRDLQSAEARVRSIIRHSVDGIVVVDKEGTIRYCNASAWSMFGTHRDELVDQPFKYPLDVEGTHQIQIEREVGSPVHVGLRVSEFDWEGVPSYLVQLRDVSERVAADIALKDSEALYHSMVETLPVQVFRKNLTGRFTFANQRLCESLGHPLEEVIGKTDLDFSPPDLAEKYIRNDLEVMESGKTFEDIEEWESPDGERIIIQVVKTPIYDSQNEIIGVQGFFIDVTDRYKAQEALKETALKLSDSNSMLKEFAYVISHDLQEPLRAVTSYLQFLVRRVGDEMDEKSLSYIQSAVDGANRMRTLIQDILSFSRVETQAKPLEPTDSRESLGRALAVLKVAISESAAVVTHDPMPVVKADATQLQQLFQNLLSNALKYRRDVPPVIHVGVNSNAATWEFTVADNGIGIEEKFQSRVFGIFDRLHTREEYEGTGIGLAICKKIVERHGGIIWLESVPGEGTTFHFSLPKHAI